MVTDDAAIPQRIKDRVIARYSGHCPKCGRELRAGHIEFDHIRSLVNGGRHAEFNLQPLCASPCHKEKTKADVAQKSRAYGSRSRHLGIRKSKHPLPCGKGSPFKKKISGEVVRR